MRKLDGRVSGVSDTEVSGVGRDDEVRDISGVRIDESNLVAMSRMKERRGRSLDD
jgi:hypothetical protein